MRTATRFILIAAACFALLAHDGYTLAQVVKTEDQKLTALDGQSGDRYGAAIAISGNTMLIGAPNDDDKAPQAGAVYVFTFDQTSGLWVQAQKLTASDTDTDPGFFGWSVAIDGDAAVIGAIDDRDNGVRSGAAYAFRRNAGTGLWVE